MSFLELRKWIREEAARMGHRCSTRQAHSVARAVWEMNALTDDLEAGLCDLRLHSDPTALEAIRNVMAAQLGQKVRREQLLEVIVN